MKQKILYISVRYKDNYIVWFKNSRNFAWLKKPAYELMKMFVNGKSKKEMISYLTINYTVTSTVARNLVNDIIQRIHQFDLPGLFEKVMPETELPHLEKVKPYSIKNYLLGNSSISIVYENQIFESIIHPLISHLETSEKELERTNYEILSIGEKIGLRKDGSFLGIYTWEETHFLKGKFFMEMAGIAHNISEGEWLMAVHASGITNGKKAILLSAVPGGGKTTLSAILIKNGFQLVSDDFVPVDRNIRAYPFPVAMSVKEGSVNTLMPYYPTLADKPLKQVTSEKKVRYLSGELNLVPLSGSYPFNEVVFVEYNPKFKCRLKKLSKAEGLIRILEQSYITPQKEFAGIFINWALKASFYKLTYSDNLNAIETLTIMFGNE